MIPMLKSPPPGLTPCRRFLGCKSFQTKWARSYRSCSKRIVSNWGWIPRTTQNNTVDGCEILHQLIDGLSHDFVWLSTIRLVVQDFAGPSTVGFCQKPHMVSHYLNNGNSSGEYLPNNVIDWCVWEWRELTHGFLGNNARNLQWFWRFYRTSRPLPET